MDEVPKKKNELNGCIKPIIFLVVLIVWLIFSKMASSGDSIPKGLMGIVGTFFCFMILISLVFDRK